MRAMWKGAVAFGLVSVPVKLYSATSQHDVPLNMVHREDGGRIRYRKVCSVDGEEVPQEEIARAHTTADGDVIILDDEDLDSLPTSTGHEIEVHEFVPAEQVDPIMLDKTYYLEPEAKATKPYALLRGALEQTDRMAVVTVTLRRRECMAVLRVRDDVIVLQTMLWPDEVRAPEFDILAKEVDVRPQELQMAASLVESMAADFDPDQYEDGWTAALRELIEAKTEGGDVRPAPLPASDDGDAQIVDLMAALRESVERTGAGRGNRGARPPAVQAVADAEDDPAPTEADTAPSTRTAARSTEGAAARTTATKAPARPASGAAARKTTVGTESSTSSAAARKPPASSRPATTTSKKTAKTTAAKTTAAKSTAAGTTAAKTTATKTAAARTTATKTAAAKTSATKTTAAGTTAAGTTAAKTTAAKTTAAKTAAAKTAAAKTAASTTATKATAGPAARGTGTAKSTSAKKAAPTTRRAASKAS